MERQSFDEARERAEQSPKDWQFGARSEPSIVYISKGERQVYLPKGELQFSAKADFLDCASRSPVNHYEALFTYHYRHGMLPENKKWFEEKGYVVWRDGLAWIEFSDRAIAVWSGTTRQGNSLKSPLEAIRTRGLVPKKRLPRGEEMTWEEYHDKAAANAPDLIALGKEFLKRFTTNYEQVPIQNLDVVLETEMVGLAGHGWPQPVHGIYQRTESWLNHAFLGFLPKYLVCDNYLDENRQGDFIKELAGNYKFFEYGYRAYISKEMVPVAPPRIFLKNLGYQMMDPEVAELQEALIALGYPIPAAVTNIYGQGTRSAVAAFQKANGIVDDGTHFGPRTRMALNRALKAEQPFSSWIVDAIAALFSSV